MSKAAAPTSDPIATGLLLINGSLIALMLTLANIATTQGVSAISYAFWQTLGAGLVLGAFTVRRQFNTLNQQVLGYLLISGATGVAIPNGTAFFVVGKIGTGFTATLYAFPPLFTLLMSLLLKLEKPSLKRFFGIGLACAGCLAIVLAQHSLANQQILLWYGLGLLIPVSLAFGNIYRSIAWPQNFSALFLASGMLLSAALLLGTLAVSSNQSLTEGIFANNTRWLILSQIVITALTYFGFFELQKRASPVFLSQMGCVAALVGLAIGLIYFKVQYNANVGLGVLVVMAGLIITIKTSR